MLRSIHQSMEELYRSGHREILYIGDIGPLRGFRLRWRAFAAAAERLGMQGLANPGEHMTEDFANRAAWMERLSDKLGSGRYTAAIAAIPGVAEWVYVSAGFLKLSIPGELSLIGMENEANPRFADLTRPLLLVREAGERAAELMLRRIANPLLPYEQVRLRGAFYQGETMVGREP